MSEKISNSSKRLKEMMDKLSLKQADVVTRTGITKSALSNYLHGSREPRQDQISKIADPYGINPAWLMGYDVPMFMEKVNFEPLNLDDSIRKHSVISNITDDEIEMITTFRSLDEDAQRQLVLMLAFLKEQDNK